MGSGRRASNSSSAGNRVKARSIKDRLSGGDRYGRNRGGENRSKELFPTKAASIVTSRGGGGQLDQLEAAIGSAHLREEDRPKIVDVSAERLRSAYRGAHPRA